MSTEARNARGSSGRPEEHPCFASFRSLWSAGSRRDRRHRETQLRVLAQMARLVRAYAEGRARLLDIGGMGGFQSVVLRDQLDRPATPVLFAERDERPPDMRGEVEFRRVDLERDRFPADDASFDVAVWNRDLVTVKDVVHPLREVRRVLAPDGLLVLSVPNLAALHNRLLLLGGRQPTTLHIAEDHVRGFAPVSFAQFLRRSLGFRELEVRSVGLHPFTSAVLPGPLRGLGHTVIWLLAKDEWAR